MMLAATADLVVHDLAGQSVIPGMIDGHTHLLWAGDRSREVSWRQAGKSYTEIAAMGGGIRSTVESTRLADDEALFALGYKRLREALRTALATLKPRVLWVVNRVGITIAAGGLTPQRHLAHTDHRLDVDGCA